MSIAIRVQLAGSAARRTMVLFNSNAVLSGPRCLIERGIVMSKYVLLFKYTEKGVANVQTSPDRAEAFIAAARKMGAKVETMLWTVGPYDGVTIVDAPDDETISALALSTAKLGNVTTCTLRAYDMAEFRKIAGKIG